MFRSFCRCLLRLTCLNSSDVFWCTEVAFGICQTYSDLDTFSCIVFVFFCICVYQIMYRHVLVYTTLHFNIICLSFCTKFHILGCCNVWWYVCSSFTLKIGSLRHVSDKVLRAKWPQHMVISWIWQSLDLHNWICHYPVTPFALSSANQ